jgi:hypothetical protein
MSELTMLGFDYPDRKNTGDLSETRAKLADVESKLAAVAGFGLDEICRIAGALKLKPCQLMERYDALLKRKRRTLRRLPYLAVSFCLAGILSPGRARAQSQAPAPADVDSGKVQPLDLKPGCWQLRTVAVMDMTGLYKHTLWAQIKAIQKMDNLTPEKRAQMVAGVEADEKKAETQSGKNVDDRTFVACTAAPFADAGKEIYGTLAKQCAKTVQVSGEARHIHIECPAANGDRMTDDYDRMDAGYFKGARESVTASSETGPNGERLITTNTWTWIGKWMGEASPHMPHVPPPADLNGVTPKRPFAVALLDPFRIVAVMEGNQLIARQAYFLINRVSSPPPPEYHAELGLATLMQNIYLRYKIAVEAVKLHLDAQEPWKHQLNDLGGLGMIFGDDNIFSGFEYDMDRDTADNYSTTTMERHAALTSQPIEKLLWNAYFSQAKTQAEKEALLQRVQEKYKLTVIDPDFFDGQTSIHQTAATADPASAMRFGAITIPKLSGAAINLPSGRMSPRTPAGITG